MSENETPQSETPQASPPPPPPPPAPASGGGAESGNRGIMIVLSYLWILALVPLLVEKEDKEVQWHAKHGLVLTGLEIVLYVLFQVIAATGIGCIFAIFIPIVSVVFLIIRVICIVKGINGERFLLPAISQYADKF